MRRMDYVQTGYYCGCWSGDAPNRTVLDLRHCNYPPGFTDAETSFRVSI